MGLTKVELKGLDDGTDGQIITYDANGNPTAVGPGTDGQVLTSTGAGSPPAFEDAAAGGAALTGSTNNTVCTVTGANAIQGEANLTFDGSALNATAGAASLTIKSTNAQTAGQLHFDGDAVTTDDYWLGNIGGRWNGNDVAAIRFEAGDDTTNKDDGRITFNVSASGSSPAEAMRIEPNKNVKITDGDLVIGTSGHGIDFSAGSHATDMSSELLDDYEEGDFTVTLSATGGGTLGISGNDHMKYTKIGNRVFISGSIDCNAHSSATGFLQVNGFPFTVEHDGQAANCSHIGVVYFRGGDSTPGSTGNYGDFAVRWTMGANETAAYAQAVYGGLTDSGSQNTAQYVGESTYIYFNFSYPAA